MHSTNDCEFAPADFIEGGFSVVIARSRRIAVGTEYDVSFRLLEADIIDRRKVSIGGGTAVSPTATSLAAPAIALGWLELEMVTTWPRNFPRLGTCVQNLDNLIGNLSG